MAAFYISEILEQNPTGPYCLAGYSFGGIIAFEMAKQLKAMGKEVKTLAIFDTNADISDSFSNWTDKVKKKAMRQLPKMKFIYNSFRTNAKETVEYQAYLLKKKVDHVLENAGLGKPEQAEEEILSAFAKRINEKHDQALRLYKMAPYYGSIDLFKVRKRIYYVDDPVYLGWKPYALNGICVHDIPGDHKTFLLPPNDKELARILQEVLDGRNIL